jgi:hypothetical protein
MKAERAALQLHLFTQPTRNATWVARHLNTSPQTVGRMIEDGTLKAFRLRERGPWHVLMESVAEYEESLLKKYSLEAVGKAAAR